MLRESHQQNSLGPRANPIGNLHQDSGFTTLYPCLAHITMEQVFLKTGKEQHLAKAQYEKGNHRLTAYYKKTIEYQLLVR